MSPLSALGRARPSPYLSLSTTPSRTLSPATMRGSAGEKRKRCREQRNHVSGMLVSQEKERERGEPPSASMCTKDIILLLFVMSSPIKAPKKLWASIRKICGLILEKQKIRLSFVFWESLSERDKRKLFFINIF